MKKSWNGACREPRVAWGRPAVLMKHEGNPNHRDHAKSRHSVPGPPSYEGDEHQGTCQIFFVPGYPPSPKIRPAIEKTVLTAFRPKGGPWVAQAPPSPTCVSQAHVAQPGVPIVRRFCA